MKHITTISTLSGLGSTEDDTFRILARPDVHKMHQLHQDWKSMHTDSTGKYDQQKNVVFARYYGWTWIEYLTARKEAGYFN